MDFENLTNPVARFAAWVKTHAASLKSRVTGPTTGSFSENIRKKTPRTAAEIRAVHAEQTALHAQLTAKLEGLTLDNSEFVSWVTALADGTGTLENRPAFVTASGKRLADALCTAVQTALQKSGIPTMCLEPVTITPRVRSAPAAAEDPEAHERQERETRAAAVRAQWSEAMNPQASNEITIYPEIP